MTPAVSAASDRAVAWLAETALPFWLAHGIDGDGLGFHEHLSLEDKRCTADFRRLRVVTRQIYVFSEAASLGIAGAAEAVAFGLAYLRRHAAAAEGGYYWRFDLRGGVIDARRDLYDHAFVLLALASAMRVAPAAAVRDDALALDAYLRTAFPHAAGGYLESLPPSLPRRQNPHMHLLEAYLAAAEAFGDPVFLASADALAELFLTRLFQPKEGALPEYFDEELTPLREDGRFVVEPGHHCEWVWLLDWHAQLRIAAGQEPLNGSLPAMRRLAHFVDSHGMHAETGALMDELWSDGGIRAAGQRLWPQTERLKAEILRPDASEARILRAYAVLHSYIDAAPPGLWQERRDAAGGFAPMAAPASSLYHLTAAIMVGHRAIAF